MDALLEWMELLPWFRSEQFDITVNLLDQQEQAGNRVVPAIEHIFDPYRWVSPDAVRVVLLQPNPGLTETTISNIFMEVELDSAPAPETRELAGWHKQGVMLLSLSLTHNPDQPETNDAFGWSGLIEETIRAINILNSRVAFVLWGAQTHGYRIRISNHHLIMMTAHPSERTGFFGSRPFSKINRYFQQHNMNPIDWSK